MSKILERAWYSFKSTHNTNAATKEAFFSGAKTVLDEIYNTAQYKRKGAFTEIYKDMVIGVKKALTLLEKK